VNKNPPTDGHLDALIDEVARDMTSAPAGADFAQRVSAALDIASDVGMAWKFRPAWLLAAAAAAAVAIVAWPHRAVAPPRLPAPPSLVESQAVVEKAPVVRELAIPSPAVTGRTQTRIEAIEPIDINPIELTPIDTTAPIAIAAIAIDRIEIPAMP
jgi:hypothetical protein